MVHIHVSVLTCSLKAQLREQVNDVCMIGSTSGADQETAKALRWMENPTDKDRLLLIPTVPAVPDVKITSLTAIACDRWSLVTNWG